MLKALVFLFFMVAILLSCKVSQETLDYHEDIKMRLREYENDAFFQENYSDTVLTDYLVLSYDDYLKKYELKHSQMEIVAAANEASISILKAARAIDRLNQLADSAQTIRRLDTSRMNLHSFDRFKSLKFVPPTDSLDTLR
ncbi:MAG: hypothetical protein DCO96_11590 [Fluviicola sp. XM-24bin1]|nr:MAG: hypothetical protein DCO96_11590 [Fluviicola sp. XM-24bin1]